MTKRGKLCRRSSEPQASANELFQEFRATPTSSHLWYSVNCVAILLLIDGHHVRSRSVWLFGYSQPKRVKE